MDIYPAIDLRDGCCVRLTQGDFEQSTIYENDPLRQAQLFIDEGARWCHVVDLDGAKDPLKHQLAIIKHIVEQTPLSIQTGGGIRNALDVAVRLQAGISRVIIGSLAVHNPPVVAQLFTQYDPDQIVLALDVLIDNDIPMVATHGWQQTSDKSVYEIIDMYLDAGLKHIICTDIQCDGTLLGPNFSLYESIMGQYPGLHLQASGGISSLEDVLALKKLGAAGVIIGKALYENKFSLGEALTC